MVINSGKYIITNLPRVYLAGVLLEYVERFKYLAMIIHVRYYDYDITRQLRSINLRINIFLGTFSKCSSYTCFSLIVLIYTVHIYGLRFECFSRIKNV